MAAVVCRGGRPDLATEALDQVRAATLLLVGGRGREVIALNEQAAAQVVAEHELSLVSDATHLFEEPGAREEVARRAASEFARTMAPSS